MEHNYKVDIEAMAEALDNEINPESIKYFREKVVGPNLEIGRGRDVLGKTEKPDYVLDEVETSKELYNLLQGQKQLEKERDADFGNITKDMAATFAAAYLTEAAEQLGYGENPVQRLGESVQKMEEGWANGHSERNQYQLEVQLKGYHLEAAHKLIGDIDDWVKAYDE